MQATSREAVDALAGRFDERVAGADISTLRQLGDELSMITGVLSREAVLRKSVGDPTASPEDRRGLVERVLGGKVSELAQGLAGDAAAKRFSRPSDLVEALELLARRAVLAAAEQQGNLDDVEDELFRFGRVLGSESRLRDLLADVSAPVERRLQLLHRLVQGKVAPDTLKLLEQAVRAPRGHGLDATVAKLAELAAGRRERSVAHVTAAAQLSPDQQHRLGQVLSRIYSRPISIQLEVDPSVVGGLVVRVGDEVIDGSIMSRLSKAHQELPGSG